jgi:hypothetical protein
LHTRLKWSDFSEMAAGDSELASLAPERARGFTRPAIHGFPQ